LPTGVEASNACLHCPRNGCDERSCSSGYLVHLNVEPSWISTEGLKCSERSRWWRWFMHGPSVCLEKALEPHARALSRVEWICPYDNKKVIEANGKLRCQYVVTFSSRWNRWLESEAGIAHRKNANIQFDGNVLATSWHHWESCTHLRFLVLLQLRNKLQIICSNLQKSAL
jgi:hypothetical protein